MIELGEIVRKHPSFFKSYERLTSSLGICSTPFVLTTITSFIACGEIPSIFLPSINDLSSFMVIIISAIISLILHEFSHVVVLINHGASDISIGISTKGVWGWFIKAKIEENRCRELILPFYSVGLGSNLLLFLLFLSFKNINPYLHIISIVNFWLLLINGIPAPLIDGGKLFELILAKLKVEKYIEVISICIMLTWMFILVLRFA